MYFSNISFHLEIQFYQLMNEIFNIVLGIFISQFFIGFRFFVHFLCDIFPFKTRNASPQNNAILRMKPLYMDQQHQFMYEIES